MFKKQIDHMATSVVHLARRGLWIAMPSSAGEVGVMRQAFTWAQARLAARAGAEAYLRAAREHAEKVLGDLVTSKGWILQAQWR